MGRDNRPKILIVMAPNEQIDPTGKKILISAGEFAGQEAICLGIAIESDGIWAVSPDGSDRIINLKFPDEFGVLLNSKQRSGRN